MEARHWTALSSGTTNPLYSVYFTDCNTGYAVGGDYDEGTILKTINGGYNLDYFIEWNILNCYIQFTLPMPIQVMRWVDLEPS